MTIEQSNEQIIKQLQNGKSLKEVAATVFLSLATVKWRLKKLRDKHECITTVQLIGKLNAKRISLKDNSMQSNNA
jgi:DNA-binding NarL/FixJ family response regulator